MSINIQIEDHAVPQLLTSAIEAYEVQHRATKRSAGADKLETFGLLWGYVLPEREAISGTDGFPPVKSVEARVIVTTATVETSAIRNGDWVSPNMESLQAKRDFMHQYWPQLELVGTFHSHPYEDHEEVKDNKGWRASAGDLDYWPKTHRHICPNMPFMAHLIITITQLKKSGSAYPTRLPGSEGSSGFALSAGMRKLWIKAYATQSTASEEEPQYFDFAMHNSVQLSAPSLTTRIWEGQ